MTSISQSTLFSANASPIMAGDWLDQVLYDINLLEAKQP
jgi:hypothetical protein